MRAKMRTGIGGFEPYTDFRYIEMIVAIEGKWVEIKTDHLFCNEFSTTPIYMMNDEVLPIEKTELGYVVTLPYPITGKVECIIGASLRISSYMIEKIEGDIRTGMYKCEYCGGHPITDICDKGCPPEYMYQFVVPDGEDESCLVRHLKKIHNGKG